MGEAVTFKFRSLQKVRIADIESYGFISSRLNNAEGQNEYKVIFWMDGKRTDAWFYEFELEPV